MELSLALARSRGQLTTFQQKLFRETGSHVTGGVSAGVTRRRVTGFHTAARDKLQYIAPAKAPAPADAIARYSSLFSELVNGL